MDKQPRDVAGHLPLRKRREQILDATELLLADVHVERLSMTMIADASGITRSWLYELFGNADEVLIALFQRSFAGLHLVVDPLEVLRTSPVDHGVMRFEFVLQMPKVLFDQFSLAFLAVPTARKAVVHLQQSINNALDANWVNPLVGLGLERTQVSATVRQMLANVISLRTLVDEGSLSQDDARRRIAFVFESAMSRLRTNESAVDSR